MDETDLAKAGDAAKAGDDEGEIEDDDDTDDESEEEASKEKAKVEIKSLPAEKEKPGKVPAKTAKPQEEHNTYLAISFFFVHVFMCQFIFSHIHASIFFSYIYA